MTAREARRLCCTCFQEYAPPGAYKCAACNFPHQPATKHPARKPLDLSKTLPENLAGYTLDFP